jgi:hypothetical protein
MFLSVSYECSKIMGTKTLFSAGLGEAFDKKYQRLNLAAVKRKTFQK